MKNGPYRKKRDIIMFSILVFLQQSTINNQQSTINNQQSAINNQQSTINKRQKKIKIKIKNKSSMQQQMGIVFFFPIPQ